MISGLARAMVFEQPEYLELCTGGEFHLRQSVEREEDLIFPSNQVVDGRFHRLNYEGKPAVLAQSEDYAFSLKRCSICTCVPLTQPDG